MRVSAGDPRQRRLRRAGMGGFSLIEVLIAMLVIAIGVLGLALLQTMNVRFTQSANQRTQATNLAYEMLDQIRINRIAGDEFVGRYTAPEGACSQTSELSSTGEVTTEAFTEAWRCRLKAVLGTGASAQVSKSAAGNRYRVAIQWNDERWTQDAAGTAFAVEAEI